jgi:type III secretion system FlhB-like substrate exporter
MADRGMGMLLLVVFWPALPWWTSAAGLLAQVSLKMSHQEVKQEHKESEGNPHMKGRMRQRQRELSHRQQRQGAVPKADFVVMNPTHYAVAIKYDDKTMGAPQVISKGADLLAMKIRDIAKGHAIPVLQSPMLARALYANAELDQDIPASLYTAVAQVLAYVYRLKAAMRGGSDARRAVPNRLCRQNSTRCPSFRPQRPCRMNTNPSTPAEMVRQQNTSVHARRPLHPAGRGHSGHDGAAVAPHGCWTPFFTLNIAIALMVMMVAAYMIRPLDFAAFPSVLLLTTLMRLSLNVASTRVVLLEGHTGPGAAGAVIEAFGHFPDRWQFCRGSDRVFHPGGDQLCRGDQGCRAYCRSVGTVHWMPCQASRWRWTPT